MTTGERDVTARLRDALAHQAASVPAPEDRWEDVEARAGQLLRRVGAWVTTTGPNGVTIESSTGPAVSVPAAVLGTAADPTGAGDAFRAGFLAGVCHGLGHEGAAQLGCAMAALVMETSGTQEYRFEPEEFLGRIAKSYGAGVTSDVATRISMPSPVPVREKV